MSVPLHLAHITPNGGRPKGYVPYSPRDRNALTAERILELYDEMRDADALPLGPRQAGYRLKERFPGEYPKEQFKAVEEIVKRLGQARLLDFSWVSDASAVVMDPGGYDSLGDYLSSLPEYERDLRQRQPVVVELYAEARETLPLIRRVAAERGVLVYSGGGSAGPKLARQAALRAVNRAAANGQSTLILGVCDFDVAGIRNILRPHIEHLSAFLYGTDERGGDERHVVASDGDVVSATGAHVSFAHLALTPELARTLVETAADREQIERYIASGTDLWDRELELLDGVQKVETEALDPRDLRDLVAGAIDAAIDTTALSAVRAQAELEREDLAVDLDALVAKYGESA